MKAASRLTAAAIFASLVGTLPAHAQVTFTGFTNGCFYTVGNSPCTPANTAAPGTATAGPLTYRNSTFEVTTVGGTAAIGNAAGLPNIDNLGSIAFPAGPVSFTNYVNQRFVLNVQFTAPDGVTSGSNIWTATLAGTVTQSAGGVRINFDNTPREFSWNGGMFTLQVDDVSLTKKSGATEIALSGFITASQTTVPEPGTWMLMAGGLVGVSVAARRRRHA